ncbi:MAG: hypothetical protein LBI05_04445 [Planctomycetaceae bacterium]|jgi:hypothetical protein|nr:hypothetical protein [Planctomycetaceae bacterium]
MKRYIPLLLLFLSGSLFSSEGDLRHVRSLSDKGLFDAAEIFCNEKLQQPDVTEIDKIALATELVLSYSQHLLLLEPAQRPRIVQRIERLESTWLTAPPDSAPFDLALAKIKLRLECAAAYGSLGNQQRLEADTASETNKRNAYQQARATLQDSVERLKKCQQELHALRQRMGSNADTQTQQRLLSLEYAITMQQGIVRKTHALTFFVEEERNFELRQAVETFSELASLTSNAPVVVQCKIEKATCHRLCGELEQCAEILKQLRAVPAAPESQLRIDAEWIRYNIAIGNAAEMRQQYAQDRDSQFYPDFELARLALFLVSDPARNIQPQSTAVMRLVQKIDRDFGSYWAKRAEMIVSVSGNRDLNSAEMLAMYADKHLQDQQYIDAAKQYEQAAAKADANRQPEKMYQYNRLAAHAWSRALEQLPTGAQWIEYQKRLIRVLRILVAQNPNHHEALELHLSAIDLQTQIVSTQPEALDDYLTLVKEHEEYWKDSPQLQNIRRQTVILLERQGRIDEAAALLPLLGWEQLETLPLEIQRLHARQLDTDGKTQSAVDLLVAILKQRREPATLQLLAEILTRQSDEKSLDYAQKLWTELTQCTAKESEMWWSAREGILEIFCKLNRRDEAKKEFEKLCILYPNLGGTERKERLVKQFK